MRRLALPLLALGSLAIAAAYAATIVGVATVAAPWWLATGTTAVLAGLAALGAARDGRPTLVLDAVTALASLSVLAGLLIPLALPAPDATARLFLGVPVATAVLLLLVGLVPLVALPIAYAFSFEVEVLSDDDLARFRAGTE